MTFLRPILLLFLALYSTFPLAEEALLDQHTRDLAQVGKAAGAGQVPVLLLVSGGGR